MTPNLPTNWENWLLSEVGTWYGGGTPASAERSYWNGDIPWVSPKDMKALRLTTSIDKITPEAIENSAAKLIPSGAVLFVTRSGILAHSFPVAVSDVAVTINQDIKAIKPADGIDAVYLAWALRAAERKILSSCSKHGTTVHSIEMPSLKELSIPIPPEPEQHRIVAKIEELFSELDKGLETLTTAREQLKAYRQSVLKHAFEGKLTEDWRARNADMLENPETLLTRIKQERETRYKQALENWEAALEEWRAKGEKGRKPAKPGRPRDLSKRSDAVAKSEIWPILEIGDVLFVNSGQGLTAQEMREGSYAVYGGNGINGSHDEYFIEEPVLVIGRVGAKCGVTHITVPKCWVTDNALIVTPLVDSFSKKFFKSLLELKNLNSLGSSTGQPVISGSKIYPVEIGVPSLAEQAEIVRLLEEKLEAAEVMETEIEAALARAQSLRESILKRAFSGKLVPQDPNDEPAAVLLARIRAERESEAPKKRMRG